MVDINKFLADITAWKSEKSGCDGVGIVIGDLLITAGDVVDSAVKVIARIDGDDFILDKSMEVFCQSMGNDDHDTSHFDCAIYRIPGIDSPFVLSDKLPEIGVSYTSAYFVEKTVESGDENVTSIFRKQSYTVVEQSDATYTGQNEANFFACKTEKILHEGNSGCPLFKDNIVYGILHGGTPGQPDCAYQSSQSILHVIETINSQKA